MVFATGGVVRSLDEPGHLEAPVARIDLARQRDHVADLETETVGELSCRRCRSCDPRERPPCFSHEADAEDIERGFRIDGELGEEILRILVDPANQLENVTLVTPCTLAMRSR